MRLTCGKCDNGWIWKSIPTSPWPHDDCGEPGVPARTPRATSASSQLVWSARAVTAHKARLKRRRTHELGAGPTPSLAVAAKLQELVLAALIGGRYSRVDGPE